MDNAKRIKPQFNAYVIDEHVKSKNITVLRTPPYYCEFNHIGLALSSVKRYVETNICLYGYMNTTFKLPNIKKLLIDGVNNWTPKTWKNFIQHVIKVEDRFWKVDFTIDDVMDNDNVHVMTVTGDKSHSDNLGFKALK